MQAFYAGEKLEFDAGVLRRALDELWSEPVHGGAWVIGNKEQQAMPLMAHMAERGWVCVSINYRLGALGFLSHPSLAPDGEPFGSWGLLDCVEALRWVQANIAAFGGDPGNVTICGQSGGGPAGAA